CDAAGGQDAGRPGRGAQADLRIRQRRRAHPDRLCSTHPRGGIMTISMPVGLMADGPPVAEQYDAEQYDWVAESGFSSGGYVPEWRLVVAPARGTFRAAGTDGTELGCIEARRDRETIVAAWHGEIIEWLVQD